MSSQQDGIPLQLALQHFQQEILLRNVISLLRGHVVLHQEGRMRLMQQNVEISQAEIQTMLSSGGPMPKLKLKYSTPDITIEILLSDRANLLSLIRSLNEQSESSDKRDSSAYPNDDWGNATGL